MKRYRQYIMDHTKINNAIGALSEYYGGGERDSKYQELQQLLQQQKAAQRDADALKRWDALKARISGIPMADAAPKAIPVADPETP